MLKSPLRYWLCRLYVLTLLPLLVLGFLYGFYEATTRQDPRVIFLSLLVSPILLPIIPMGLTLFAFPFQYSAFGKYKRTPLPDETPVTVIKHSIILFAVAMRSPARLIVYRSGLGMKLSLVGTVFVPLADIDSIKETRWSWMIVHHHCRELRTPFQVQSMVGKMLFQCWGESLKA